MDRREQNYRRVFAVLLFLFGIGQVPVFTQEAPIKDTDKEWRIGVGVFDSSGLTDEFLYLARSMPGAVFDRISRIDDHYLDDEEYSAYQQRLLERFIREKRKDIAQKREEASEILFDRTTADRKTTRGVVEERIAVLEEELLWIQSIDPADIPAERMQPVVLHSSGRSGRLIEGSVFGPEETARQYDLDMYIHGRVEQIEDTLYFEVQLWNRALGENELTVRRAGAPEQINRLVDEMLSEIKESVLGKAWAELIIVPDPADAAVYLDGNFLGSGRSSAETLEPGTHLLEVRSEGHGERKIQLVLKPYEKRTMEVTLVLQDAEDIFVQSDPSGAMVYLDAVWVGRTPLILQRPSTVSQLLLKKQSFVPRIFKVDEGTASDITVELSPGIIDRGQYIKEKRNAFYRAAGMFALSFPVPFFLYSMSMDYAAGYAAAAAGGYSDEEYRMRQFSDGFYHGFLGGVVISVSLLVHTIYTLIDYIRTADSKP